MHTILYEINYNDEGRNKTYSKYFIYLILLQVSFPHQYIKFQLTHVQESTGVVHKGFDYTRTNHPTRKILEDLITNLEHGYASNTFASPSIQNPLKLGSYIVVDSATKYMYQDIQMY
ncbi:PLP-dependent transferase [Blattabacterium cuenoti]|uniref:PLP-dependent transferase n=1 Tax=Blattabacterium cuenoti TaxID=1653831 RepID=UPI00311EE86B